MGEDMDLQNIARYFAAAGILFLVLAGGFALLARLDIPLAKLPGNILIRREHFTCIFPLALSIGLSLVLSLVLNLIIRVIGK